MVWRLPSNRGRRRTWLEGVRLTGSFPGLGPFKGCERLFHSPPPPSSCHPVPLLTPYPAFPNPFSSLVLHNTPVRISSCFASERNCDPFREKPCSNISSSCWWPIHDLIWETHHFAGFSVPIWVSTQMGLPFCLGWVPLCLVSSVGIQDDLSYDNEAVSFSQASPRALSLMHKALGSLLHFRKNYRVEDVRSLFKTFYYGKLKM